MPSAGCGVNFAAADDGNERSALLPLAFPLHLHTLDRLTRNQHSFTILVHKGKEMKSTMALLWFGSGRGLADKLGMMLLFLGLASLLGVLLVVTHLVLLVKGRNPDASDKVRRWSKGLSIAHLVLAVPILSPLAIAPSSSDSLKSIPFALLFLLLGFVGLVLNSKVSDSAS